MTDPQKDYQQYLWTPFTQLGDLSNDEPMVMVSGDGARITGSQGRTFIDAHGALWLANAGFGCDEIVDAAYEQMKDLSYLPSFGGISNEAATGLAHRLVEMAADMNMSRVFFLLRWLGSGGDGPENGLAVLEAPGKAGQTQVRCAQEPIMG